MKRIIKWLIIITIAVIALTACRPSKALATTRYRYTTQTVNLKNKVKGHKVYRVKRNTRVRLIKTGKRWAKVRYKGETLVCKKKFLHRYKSPKKYSGSYFRSAGVIWWRDQKFTWYSQRILPGYGLRIPGRHLDGQGFVCDGKGYIVLGSNIANRGKIIATPFGRYGKVYDAGYVGTYWFDCYTNF